MTTTQKGAKAQRRHALMFALIDATNGTDLRRLLTEYEATGDHDHGRGPIKPGAPCNGYLGDDCWVKRARASLAAIEALDHVSTVPLAGKTA
jgi:hypothetical protein